MGSSAGNAASTFTAFLEAWMVRQEHYLDELLSCGDGDDYQKELVARVLAHYQQYYEEKSKIADRNVFLVFSPPWLTALERAFLWIAGFKPGLAFGLVADAVPDLSEDQRRRIARLKKETRAEERYINDEYAKIHESVAAPPLLEAVRSGLYQVDGLALTDRSAAVGSLASALEAVVSAADELRANTALKVVEVLRPAQSLRFLAAAAQLQLKLRKFGLERATGSDE